MLNKKIIICCTIKNEEKNLKNFFTKIKNIISRFEDYYLIFSESESSDKSKQIINSNLKNLKGICLKPNTSIYKNRTKKLEIARNAYLNYIKKNSELIKFDYLFVMDADRINYLLSYKKIKESIEIKKQWTALFANQIFFYYDLWALRIKNIFDYDCFDKLFKNIDYNNKLSTIFKKIFYENMFLINKSKSRLINVQSAFGGFAIYKLSKIIKFHYDSNNGKNCEHVKFHLKINKKYKNLFIDKIYTYDKYFFI